MNNQAQPLNQNIAYSYGGYCMQLDAEHLILGASFYPGRDDAEVLAEDHMHNYELIHGVFPEYVKSLPSLETCKVVHRYVRKVRIISLYSVK